MPRGKEMAAGFSGFILPGLSPTTSFQLCGCTSPPMKPGLLDIAKQFQFVSLVASCLGHGIRYYRSKSAISLVFRKGASNGTHDSHLDNWLHSFPAGLC